VIDGRRTQLKDNSIFICFAPRENPRIAVAVVVENAGYGATWAGPIARIMLEKYLNDTLQTKSKEDLERIANSNIMPPYLKRLQFIEDSTRARRWFETYGDTSFLKKYISIKTKPGDKNPFKNNKSGNKKSSVTEGILTESKQLRKSSFQPVS
jgi:penicillin-binding protein 2